MAIAKIIQYEGDNSTFIWKHPTVDFNSMTQLIVRESQEAVFMMNGVILDTFTAGKYNLDTESLPILGKFVDGLVYGEASFAAEVYFINQTVQMGLKWGTSPKIRFIEPMTGIPFEIGMSGNLNLRVKDSKKLLVKLVGTQSGIAWDSEPEKFHKSLQECFRPLIITAVRTNFAPIVKENNINIIEIDQYVEKLSKPMLEKIDEGFDDYGLKVVDLYITDIVLPEEDDNFKRIKKIMSSSYLGIKEAQVEADIIAARRAIELEQQQTLTAKKQMELQRELLQAQLDANKTKLSGLAEAEVMAAKGYNQKDILQAEVQKAYADALGNFGPDTVTAGNGSSVASDMMSMQMGMMAANAMSGQMKEMMNNMTGNQSNSNQPQPNAGQIYCPNCGSSLPVGAKFCMNCGQQLIVTNKCPNCGSELPAGAKFCLNCGQKIGE